MNSFFQRLFRSSGRRPTTAFNRSRFRPSVEALEAREVPALFTWVGSGFGAGADFDTPANWTYNGGGTATRLPAAGDDLAFISSMSGNANNVHGPASGAYNSVSLNGAYTSTITLIGGFTTASLTLDAAGAAISQPIASGGYSNTDIRVTSSFNWTNGTLNSSANLSNLILDGATALIAPRAIMDMWNPMSPPIPGKVTTGDLLKLVNGALLTENPGEVDFANGAGMDIGDSCTATMAPTVQATVSHKDVSHKGGMITVQQGGALTVTGQGDILNLAVYDDELPMVNFGYVVIRNASNMSVTVTQPAVGNPQPAYYQYTDPTGATTSIENGSQLTALSVANNETSRGLVWIDGGDFHTYRPNLNDTLNNAKVDGNMKVTRDTTVRVGINANVNKPFNRLQVLGTVDWQGGTYVPRVDNSGLASLWQSNGAFTVAAGVSITPIQLSTPLVNQTFKIIQGSSVTGPTPSVQGWTVLINSPTTEWNIKYTP